MTIYKGNIVFSKSINELAYIPDGFIIVENGIVVDAVSTLPGKYDGARIVDFGDKLIIPGFIDAHLHAPQFENIGFGYDKELLEWLDTYTFPEEAKFKDADYAKDVYSDFVNELAACGTTRSVVFGTIHKQATEILFDLFDKAGIGGYIGKVNMDLSKMDGLSESAEQSLEDTLCLIERWSGRSPLLKPVITPRFAPVCSERLMKELGKIAEKHCLPVQTHINEAPGEVDVVKSIFESAKNYASVYEDCGLLGERTILAHCVHNTNDEIELYKQKAITVAHCPISNIDLKSGIAPAKMFLRSGISIGLGSDISGGHSMFMPDVIVSAISASKLYNIYVDNSYEPLTLAEAFYMATKGGGKIFGKVSAFEPGYDFDALLISDDYPKLGRKRDLPERFSKFIYSAKKTNIVKRFVKGNEIIIKGGKV